MRVTQGTFSFLPPLNDEEIALQLSYAMGKGWPIVIETTDDPHPRNTYWTLWGLPMFDEVSPARIVEEINTVRRRLPNTYIRVSAYDASYGRQTVGLSFLVGRPAHEPGFALERMETADRQMRYTISSYAVTRAEPGARYLSDQG
jgi:ribulose-bisphosphate carboxylase small chain